MQIKFKATELKKARKYVEKLTYVEEKIKEEEKKNSSFLKGLLKFLFK
jgi:hypothetical protein